MSTFYFKTVTLSLYPIDSSNLSNLKVSLKVPGLELWSVATTLASLVPTGQFSFTLILPKKKVIFKLI